MKIEIVKKEESKKAIEFPIVMESKETGNIVLFTKKYEGIILKLGHNPHKSHYEGLYSNWTPCDESGIWKPFKGKIIIDC
jgi:hypothetical protein